MRVRQPEAGQPAGTNAKATIGYDTLQCTRPRPRSASGERRTVFVVVCGWNLTPCSAPRPPFRFHSRGREQRKTTLCAVPVETWGRAFCEDFPVLPHGRWIEGDLSHLELTPAGNIIEEEITMNNINGNAHAGPSSGGQNSPNAHSDVSKNTQNYGGQQACHDNDANIMQRLQLLQQQQMAAMRMNPMLAMNMMQQNPMMAMAATSQSNPVVQRDQMQHLQANQHALYSQLMSTGNPIALQMLSQGYNPSVVLLIMSNPNLNLLGTGINAVSDARAAQGHISAAAAHKSSKTISKKTKRSNKPKRPLSAYNFFFREERARIIKEELPTEDEKKKGVESKPDVKTVEDNGGENRDRVNEKKNKENEGGTEAKSADAGGEVARKDAAEDETAKDGTKGAIEGVAAVKREEGDGDNSAKKEGSESKSDDTKSEKDGGDETKAAEVKTETKFEKLAKEIGQRWRAIDKEGDDFKRYKRMADDDLERYKKDMDAYNTAEMRDTVGIRYKKMKTQQGSRP